MLILTFVGTLTPKTGTHKTWWSALHCVLASLTFYHTKTFTQTVWWHSSYCPNTFLNWKFFGSKWTRAWRVVIIRFFICGFCIYIKTLLSCYTATLKFNISRSSPFFSLSRFHHITRFMWGISLTAPFDFFLWTVSLSPWRTRCSYIGVPPLLLARHVRQHKDLEFSLRKLFLENFECLVQFPNTVQSKIHAALCIECMHW